MKAYEFPAVVTAAKTFCNKLALAAEYAETLSALIERVDVSQDGLKIKLTLLPLLDKLSKPKSVPIITQDIAMRLQPRH